MKQEFRVIFLSNDLHYRIVELVNLDYDIENLKGDCFNPKYIDQMNPGITVEQLRAEELVFEEHVASSGVYGYMLERWNPAPGVGWEHLDSCWGFVGPHHHENNSHYIVDELKSQIPQGELV